MRGFLKIMNESESQYLNSIIMRSTYNNLLRFGMKDCDSLIYCVISDLRYGNLAERESGILIKLIYYKKHIVKDSSTFTIMNRSFVDDIISDRFRYKASDVRKDAVEKGLTVPSINDFLSYVLNLSYDYLMKIPENLHFYFFGGMGSQSLIPCLNGGVELYTGMWDRVIDGFFSDGNSSTICRRCGFVRGKGGQCDWCGYVLPKRRSLD